MAENKGKFTVSCEKNPKNNNQGLWEREILALCTTLIQEGEYINCTHNKSIFNEIRQRYSGLAITGPGYECYGAYTPPLEQSGILGCRKFLDWQIFRVLKDGIEIKH